MTNAKKSTEPDEEEGTWPNVGCWCSKSVGG